MQSHGAPPVDEQLVGRPDRMGWPEDQRKQVHVYSDCGIQLEEVGRPA